MGRTIYAETRLLNYITSHQKSDEYVTGLILGQNSGQKDYIVHLAKTPPPVGENVVEETIMSSSVNTIDNSVKRNHIKSINDIQESWIADHAKHVTRMLPGGMRVRGIFIVGPNDIFSENINIQKIRSILFSISKNLSHNKFLYGTDEEESLILSFNTMTSNHTCKSMNVSKDGILKPAEWKFQSKACQWHQLQTIIDFNQVFHIGVDKDPETLKKQLENILENISKTINSALVVIQGEVRSPDDPIEIISKKQKDKHRKEKSDSEDQVLSVNLYIPCNPQNSNSEVKITPCSSIMRLTGQLFGRIFLYQKANVEEACNAIKQDIIRSLASRLEMHWDSLIEEENGSPEEKITLHEPPRRVLITLPESKVTFSDYLFPGEGPQEALISSQELLDLKVQENYVEKDIELQADPSEFYCQSDINKASVINDQNLPNDRLSTGYVVALILAILVIFGAVIIHYMF